MRAYYLREALAVGAARAREGLSRRARALLAAEPALRWLARRVFDTKDRAQRRGALRRARAGAISLVSLCEIWAASRAGLSGCRGRLRFALHL